MAIIDTLIPYARAYRLIEEATPDRRAHVLHVLTSSNPEARRLIIALLDPDEAMLADTICDICDCDPCACCEEDFYVLSTTAEVQSYLVEHQNYCDACGQSLCVCDDEEVHSNRYCGMCATDYTAADRITETPGYYQCAVCGAVDDLAYPNDEPTMAGEVTGYDNGPTFW